MPKIIPELVLLFCLTFVVFMIINYSISFFIDFEPDLIFGLGVATGNTILIPLFDYIKK